jgi:hypothetical protein
LWVFRSRIYRKTFRANKKDVQEDCRNLRVEEFFRAYALPILFGRLTKEKEMDLERDT